MKNINFAALVLFGLLAMSFTGAAHAQNEQYVRYSTWDVNDNQTDHYGKEITIDSTMLIVYIHNSLPDIIPDSEDIHFEEPCNPNTFIVFEKYIDIYESKEQPGQFFLNQDGEAFDVTQKMESLIEKCHSAGLRNIVASRDMVDEPLCVYVHHAYNFPLELLLQGYDDETISRCIEMGAYRGGWDNYQEYLIYRFILDKGVYLIFRNYEFHDIMRYSCLPTEVLYTGNPYGWYNIISYSDWGYNMDYSDLYGKTMEVHNEIYDLIQPRVFFEDSFDGKFILSGVGKTESSRSSCMRINYAERLVNKCFMEQAFITVPVGNTVVFSQKKHGWYEYLNFNVIYQYGGQGDPYYLLPATYAEPFALDYNEKGTITRQFADDEYVFQADNWGDDFYRELYKVGYYENDAYNNLRQALRYAGEVQNNNYRLESYFWGDNYQPPTPCDPDTLQAIFGDSKNVVFGIALRFNHCSMPNSGTEYKPLPYSSKKQMERTQPIVIDAGIHDFVNEYAALRGWDDLVSESSQRCPEFQLITAREWLDPMNMPGKEHIYNRLVYTGTDQDGNPTLRMVRDEGKMIAPFTWYIYCEEDVDGIDITYKLDTRLQEIYYPYVVNHETLGLSTPEKDTDRCAETAIFTTEGVRVSQVRTGVNIIKMSDGRTKKVIVR